MKMKRFIMCFMMTAAFLLVCCSEPAEEIFNEDFNTDSDKIDLNGAEIVFGTNWYNYYYENDQETLSGDMMRKRYNDVMAEYNCVYTVVKTADSPSETMLNISAGLPTFDMLDSHTSSSGYSLFKAGVLLALEDISTVDSTDIKWGPVALARCP